MSLYMGWEQQRDFIRDHLGPEFERNNIDAKIWVFDHNYNYDNIPDQQGYPLHIFADEEASKYIAGSAWHNYGGRVSELDRIAEAYPDKEIVLHDERFTSVMAQRTILESGIGKMARRDKALVDRVAATIILQSYMDSIGH